MTTFEDNPNSNPGEDPTGEPLGGYKIEFDEEINNQPLKIQCSWANCFTEPVWDRGLCIRSYDRKVLVDNKDTLGIIGTTTGKYHITADEVIWIEAKLKLCDRRPTGWFRESDVWHAKKGTIEPEHEEPDTKKKTNWLTWLITGASVLRILS